jgi:hypothetical protein
MALKSSALESSSVSRSHPLEASVTTVSKKSDSSMKRHARKARAVHFNKSVKVATIPHIKDFSKEDISLIWYAPDEYTQCRDSCMKIIRRMDEMEESTGSASPCAIPGGNHDVSSRCTRGLECYAKTKSTQRRIRRLAATDAVLTEQHFQYEEGRYDPDFLRQVYQHITAPCQVEAHLTALQDEKEAIRCYNMMESTTRVTFLGSASLPSPTSISTLQAANLSCGRLERPRN